MATNLISVPVVTGSVPQNFVIEALGGPTNPRGLLDRFPDEVYSKAPESHFMRLLYVLLGPSGIGQIRKNYLEARLLLEAHGLETFDLDRFYGNPLGFGRVFDEVYDEDVDGLVDRDTWEMVKARDAQYRARAMDFLGGVRLGNTPEGMRLVARSGLGHDVEIVENYRYFYDIHSDDKLGHRYYGKTTSTNEFIVLPRQDINRNAIQTLTMSGTPTGGYFVLVFNGVPSLNIPYDAPGRSDYSTVLPVSYDANGNILTSPTEQGVQEALEHIPAIGQGQVRVEGNPPNPWVVTFTGTLSSQAVPTLVVENHLTGGSSPTVTVDVTQGGLDGSEEIVNIPPRDVYHLQTALDRLRPVGTLPTIIDAQGTRAPQPWGSAFATSNYSEVLRFVTGNPTINWPVVDSRHWVIKRTEIEAPRVFNDLSQHYVGYHNPVSISATSELGGPSERVGGFGEQIRAFSYFAKFKDPGVHFTADRALADFPEQPLPTDSNTILGIYPADYLNLSGIPVPKYHDEHFWASADRTSGAEYLEIDLGSAQAVNYLAFEFTRKPTDITIYYDSLDQSPTKRWVAVTPEVGASFPDHVIYDPQANSPWDFLEFHFTNVKSELIFTRFIRIKFNRGPGDFLFDTARSIQYSWSVDVRNLRLGRNVAPG